MTITEDVGTDTPIADLRSRVTELNEVRARTRLGPSPDATARQHARGKLTVQERLDLLLDDGSALLPTLPGVSRIRLRSASTELLRQPSEKAFHLLQLRAPHGAQAPRGAAPSSLSASMRAEVIIPRSQTRVSWAIPNLVRTTSTASVNAVESAVLPGKTRIATGRPAGSVSSPYSICSVPFLPSRE
jgi:hypothetical protein